MSSDIIRLTLPITRFASNINAAICTSRYDDACISKNKKADLQIALKSETILELHDEQESRNTCR